ncbi:iron ABC transporter permease [Bacillus carboniphilus]|uniref:Iron ABC transporter permease n=1 Tax=Bacillus carboniphilus TaxID=86663 RepID=A0ABY9JWQ4_9BACI|nr:iron ABC transporter permease [Bacillus carboniphilus]WLR43827.1 iron ABC transporter permease [Bacillus carboniphilus]
MKKTISFPSKLLITSLFLIISSILSLVFGATQVSLHDVWLALTTNTSQESLNIIWELRLPRGVGAIFVGAALAISGAIMQGLTRNPLADPGLLGLTAGANAALAFVLALFPTINYLGVTFACFIGSAVGAAMVFTIGSFTKGGFSPFRIVLAGSAISAFLFAIAEGIGLQFKISKDVSMWTAGGLMGTTWDQLVVIIPIVSASIILSLLLSKQLTILSLNEDVAVGLGQNTKKVKILLFLVITLLTGASVALVGNLAFIGLMIPHIARVFVGTDYRFILPMSALVGACFMLLADLLGRTIHAPYETPVAAIVSILGLPFFLFVVHKGGRAFS